jgi:GNAT superfamily N-acetyltransferase
LKPAAAEDLPPSLVPGLHTIEFTPGNESQLQRFFDSNPQYFIAVTGEPAGPTEAREEILAGPPAGWSFTKRWLIGYVEPDGSVAAMADVISDLLARGVWHIGLFIVATSRHGNGDAQTLYRGIEDWARGHGANWLRLGVVKGNVRAERFWDALGFVQTRTREGISMGKRTNAVRVMGKPLAGGSLEQYLSIVPRDRPDAT